jgi:hypothetical protein
VLMAGDDEFLRMFEAAELGLARFGHHEHLRMAWLYTTRCGRGEAEERATSGIRHLAERHGAPHKYHETLTRAWVRAVAHYLGAGTHTDDFENFLRRHPSLMRNDLMLSHYTAGLLWSDDARARWIEPDLSPIPV